MKKCPNCGAELDDDVRFCPDCGEPLGGKSAKGKKGGGCGKVFLIFVGMIILFIVVVVIISNINDARRDNARATETSIAKTEAMRITETWIGEGRPTHTPTNTATITPIPSNTPVHQAQPQQGSSNAVGVDPDLKAWLDRYETFMGEYAAMMSKHEDFMAEEDALDMEDMSAVDFAYYMEVLDRIDTKMRSTY